MAKSKQKKLNRAAAAAEPAGLGRAGKKQVEAIVSGMLSGEAHSLTRQRKTKTDYTSMQSLGKLYNRLKGSMRVLSVTNINNAQAMDNNWLEFGESSRLGSIMSKYERWFVHKLVFEYVPLLPTTAAGTVHMMPEYDARDAPPPLTSIVRDMAQNFGYVSGPASAPLVCEMPNIKMPSGRYLFDDLFVAPRDSVRFTDFGRCLLYTQGIDAGYTDVGTVIMHYDITVSLPQISGELPDVAESTIDRLKLVATTAGGSADPTAILTGTSPTAGLRFFNGGSAVSLAQGDVITGIISSISSGMELSANGTKIDQGSRIYAKPTTTTYDNTGNTFAADVTSTVAGFFSADRDFTTPIAFAGATDDYIQLEDVKRFISTI